MQKTKFVEPKIFEEKDMEEPKEAPLVLTDEVKKDVDS